MIKKRKIVLASFLKPVDDPRMFEKFALTMAQANKYDINIIGFASKNISDHPDIHFHPLFHFKRLSLRRLLAPFKYWQKLIQVKPEVIVVTTHDLLIVSCTYKTLFGCKLVYDIQENYKANIIWSSSLPWGFRQLLAYGVRLKEHLLKRMIIHFFIAEKCYLNECSFIFDSYTILENKARKPFLQQQENESPGIQKQTTPLSTPSERKSAPPLQLIYSGTIAESYGIFDCLQLIERWVSEGKRLQLTIVGYCPRKDTLEELQLRIKDKPYIRLIGGESIVPHQIILQELVKADFALISYLLNPSNQACMPTRIWECLAYKVPMIMKKEHPWVSLLKEYQAGISLDYLDPHPADFPASTPSKYSYTTPIPESFYWEHEGKKLLKSLDSLF